MAFNILIVDDSATTRSMISRTLRMAEVPIRNLFEAGNGKEALQVLEDQWVDLVLADLNMPVMNGLELIDQMARDGLLQTIPVVIVSTEGSETRVEELKAKGVSDYVRKPFTPEVMRDVVNAALGALGEDREEEKEEGHRGED